MKPLHRNELISEIKREFPELKDELNAQDGLISLELYVFRQFTMRMIGRGERETVSRCYQIMENHYVGGDDKLRDAIDTCYVEDLEFPNPKKKDRSWAWDILPDRLKKLYTDFHGPWI